MPSFPTTRWTLVLDVGRDNAAGRVALAELCQAYWYPLYAFVRRRHAAEDAQDLTQAFFEHLLDKQSLGQISPAKGRFRSFLLAALQNYLVNEWEKQQARKRGGGQAVLSLDCDEAEARYRLEPSHKLTAEKLFERRWALTLLEQVLAALEKEYDADGKGELFEALKPGLVGGGESYAAISLRLGRTEGSVKVAAHRLRQRYRERLRRAIAETVPENEIDDEVSYLLSVLSET